MHCMNEWMNGHRSFFVCVFKIWVCVCAICVHSVYFCRLLRDNCMKKSREVHLWSVDIHVDHHNPYTRTQLHAHPCTKSKTQQQRNETKRNDMWFWATHNTHDQASTFVKQIPYGRRRAFINCLFGSFDQTLYNTEWNTQKTHSHSQKCDLKRYVSQCYYKMAFRT